MMNLRVKGRRQLSGGCWTALLHAVDEGWTPVRVGHGHHGGGAGPGRSRHLSVTSWRRRGDNPRRPASMSQGQDTHSIYDTRRRPLNRRGLATAIASARSFCWRYSLSAASESPRFADRVRAEVTECSRRRCMAWLAARVQLVQLDVPVSTLCRDPAVWPSIMYCYCPPIPRGPALRGKWHQMVHKQGAIMTDTDWIERVAASPDRERHALRQPHLSYFEASQPRVATPAETTRKYETLRDLDIPIKSTF